MTTAVIDNLGTHLGNPANQQKPNAIDKPKGHAVIGPGNRYTPAASLEPDGARNEADQRRRQAEAEQADKPIQSIEEVPEEGPESAETRSLLSDDEPDDDEERNEKTKVDIQDVLKCKKDDYHGILGIGDKYDTPMLEMSAIETAVWNRGTDLHPKYNMDEKAGEAFQSKSAGQFVKIEKSNLSNLVVCDAGRALGCGEVVLEEVNNYEGEGETEDENEGDMDGLEIETPWPTPFVSNIYNEATTHITALQRYPKLASIHKKLDAFNDQIRTQNVKDGIDPDKGVINYKTLLEKYEKIGLLFRHLDDNPNDDNAVQQGHELNNDLENFLENNKYPNHWIGKSENYKVMKQKNLKPKAARQAPAPSTAQTPAPQASAPSTAQTPAPQASAPSAAQTPAPQAPAPSAAQTPEPQASAPSTAITPQARVSFSPTAGAPTPKLSNLTVSKPKPSSSTTTTKWRPGLTEKGERILGMAPVETKDVLGNLTISRCRFLVEKRGEKNPIVFEDAVQIGEKAAQGYLKELPKAERVDMRYKKNAYSTKDQNGFLGIYGVTPEEGENPRIFPSIGLVAKYDYGWKAMNRSSFRDIWKSKADRMIEDFFLSNELDIPWMKEAKRPGCSQYPEYRNGPDRSRSSEHPERGRNSNAPGRRRGSSVRSTTSYFSDEGSERLEAVEKRLEGMEDRLMKSMEDRLTKSMESATAKFTVAMEGLMAQMAQMRAV
jgi:hypothetical protein